MVLSDIHSFIPIVLKACVEASEAIMTVYESNFDKTIKADGSPVTKADLISNAIIKKALEQTKLPTIMEESINEPFEIRKKWDTVWIVDPLDGTKEFVKRNGEFVICIALVHKNQPVLGFIASPVEKKIIFGGKEIPAKLVSFKEIDQQKTGTLIPIKTEVNKPLRMTGSRSHYSRNEQEFIEEMRDNFGEIEFIQKGSALKFFDLALGKAAIYPRFAPTMEWDIAAGQAIMESLGGSVEQVGTNRPLTYNKENLLNPYFIVKTKAVIDQLKK
jgi:3'(2'), 5'-bisphosphate nucleotidase